MKISIRLEAYCFCRIEFVLVYIQPTERLTNRPTDQAANHPYTSGRMSSCFLEFIDETIATVYYLSIFREFDRVKVLIS